MSFTPALHSGRQTAPISGLNSAGDNIAIAGTTNCGLIILSYQLFPASAVSITVKTGSGGGATSLTGAMPFGGSGNPPGFVGGENAEGWFIVPTGLPLNIYLGGAVDIEGFINFRLTGPLLT
jgi:hypothetical protein